MQNNETQKLKLNWQTQNMDPQAVVGTILDVVRTMYEIYKTVQGNKEQCKLLVGKYKIK